MGRVDGVIPPSLQNRLGGRGKGWEGGGGNEQPGDDRSVAARSRCAADDRSAAWCPLRRNIGGRDRERGALGS